jgi:hypothetical protein
MVLNRVALRVALLAFEVALLNSSHGATPSGNAAPETVRVTYHVRAGSEAALKRVLVRAWDLYRRRDAVMAEPHVVLREEDGGGAFRLVEIFTWTSADIPDHAPKEITDLWAEEQALCEGRNGRPAIEDAEVDLVLPAVP